VGAQFEKSDIEKGYRNFITGRESVDYTNVAGYGQYRHRTKLLSETNFIAGLRYDYNDKYGTEFSLGQTFNPRVGVVSKPFESIIFKILAGTAFRAPNNFEIYSETTQRIKNLDLKPEKEKTVELSLIFQPSKSFVVEGNAFYNIFEDIITSNVQTNSPIYDTETGSFSGSYYLQNRNQGDAVVKGFEIKTMALFSKNLNGFSNLTFQKTERDMVEVVKNSDGTDKIKNGNFVTKTATYEVPNIAEIKANFGVTYTWDDLITVYFVNNWVGQRTTAVSNPIENIDGYSITNSSLFFHKIFIENLKASLTVNNIFNSDYVDPGIRSASGGYYGTQHVQPGRSLYGKLIFSF